MRGLWAIGLAFAMAAAVGGVPMSVFVVHCEPTTADAVHWDALVDLVAPPDRCEVALSIDFSAQWAAMILDDPEKAAALRRWLAAGHEIGCHRHPYWATLGRAASWDGYTNTPVDQLRAEHRAEYICTTEEFMALLAALPGDRRSGRMGTFDARDEVDWPCSLSYSTVGSGLEDTVSLPTVRSIGACAVTEIGHALIVSQERGAPRLVRTCRLRCGVRGGGARL